MSQSSNDTFPTAMHIARGAGASRTSSSPPWTGLIETFRRLEAENEGVVKSGRTHLQDATPIKLLPGNQRLAQLAGEGHASCIAAGAEPP